MKGCVRVCDQVFDHRKKLFDNDNADLLSIVFMTKRGRVDKEKYILGCKKKIKNNIICGYKGFGGNRRGFCEDCKSIINKYDRMGI